ncbi:MAG TPA: hypothetical protein VLY23_14240 [Candidatus Acidoferrum sp.]|nr:hypothetical protein [Candidatus Acidoferrum sp.]
MMTSERHDTKLGFLSWKIIRHIEVHSEELADSLWARVEHCLRLRQFRERVPPQELRQRAFEIYHNLGEWLETKSEADVEHRYTAIGERRASQGVPLSQLVLVIVATKEHLWEHITSEVLTEHALELFQVLELSRCIEMFFDRAVYFAAAGYEHYQSTHHRETVVAVAVG